MPSLRDAGAYLATCSEASLQSFALAKMDEVSYLLKQLSETFAQAVQQRAEGELALWLLAHRQDLVPAKVPVRRALPASRKMLKARKEERR